jgi:hypothetical protein
MTDVTARIVYVQSADSSYPFAWYQGYVLTEKQYGERSQIHRELNEIVRDAAFDRDTPWGRVARSRDRLLVEATLIPPTAATEPLTVTVVLAGLLTRSGWETETASGVASVLDDHGYRVDQDRLADAFVWSRMRGSWLRRIVSFLTRGPMTLRTPSGAGS